MLHTSSPHNTIKKKGRRSAACMLSNVSYYYDIEDKKKGSLLHGRPWIVLCELNQAARERGTTQALVLLVEDRQDRSRLIADILEGAYHLVTAHDSQEGLEQALTLKPDLILCDVMMPAVSGEQLVSAVRAHSELDAIPILLLSAGTDDTVRVQSLQAGAQDYLVRPFHPEELRVRVANLITMKQTRQQLQREVASQQQDIATLANEVTSHTRAPAHARDPAGERSPHRSHPPDRARRDHHH
jgi:CheY-like chemotaxis protein